MDKMSNDTLLMILWCIRQDDWTEHSPDVQSRYENVLNETIERKNRGLLPLWSYFLPIVHNDLSCLTDIDNDIVSAFVNPIFLT